MTPGTAPPVSRAPRAGVRRTLGALEPGPTLQVLTRGWRSARGMLYEEGMHADAKTLELLQLLGKAWIVTLTSSREDDAWQLRIDSPLHWDESFSYTYRGPLASVVHRAYEGAPDDGAAEVTA